jgi:hypothetical protein
VAESLENQLQEVNEQIRMLAELEIARPEQEEHEERKEREEREGGVEELEPRVFAKRKKSEHEKARRELQARVRAE